jgi:virginiamycin B lyase
MSAKSLLPLIASALVASLLTATAQQPGQDFPEGEGRSIVISQCGRCHELDRVTGGYTPEGWRTVVRTMQNFGMELPQEQVRVATEYLILNFPAKVRPAATSIPRLGRPIVLEQVCDKRGVCCLGDSEACFGADVQRR